jgi:hypothetical protein
MSVRFLRPSRAASGRHTTVADRPGPAVELPPRSGRPMPLLSRRANDGQGHSRKQRTTWWPVSACRRGRRRFRTRPSARHRGGAWSGNAGSVAAAHAGARSSGNAFQSPFASPPGEGLSSSTINVLWGLFNLAVAYLLIGRVGDFNLRKTTHVLTSGAGVLLMSLMAARAFGRFHGGL